MNKVRVQLEVELEPSRVREMIAEASAEIAGLTAKVNALTSQRDSWRLALKKAEGVNNPPESAAQLGLLAGVAENQSVNPKKSPRLRRGLAQVLIPNLLQDSEAGMELEEIQKNIGVSGSTVWRILNKLRENGEAEQLADGKWKLKK